MAFTITATVMLLAILSGAQIVGQRDPLFGKAGYRVT
jgi:hypothetical protein